MSQTSGRAHVISTDDTNPVPLFHLKRNLLERPEFFDILVCMTLQSANFRQQSFGFVDDDIPQRNICAVGLMADQISFPEILSLNHNVAHVQSSNNIRKLLLHFAKLINSQK